MVKIICKNGEMLSKMNRYMLTGGMKKKKWQKETVAVKNRILNVKTKPSLAV